MHLQGNRVLLTIRTLKELILPFVHLFIDSLPTPLGE